MLAYAISYARECVKNNKTSESRTINYEQSIRECFQWRPATLMDGCLFNAGSHPCSRWLFHDDGQGMAKPYCYAQFRCGKMLRPITAHQCGLRNRSFTLPLSPFN